MVAVAAAVVIFVQSLLSSWTVGAMAAQPMLDAFGNPLCITGTDAAGKRPAGDHSSMPNCCAFGCGQASTTLAPPPGDAVQLLRHILASDARPAFTAAVLVQDADHNPGSPRAPPMAA